MFTVTVQDAAVRARLKAMPAKVQMKLLQTTYILALKLEAAVKAKLSGQVLKVRSGNLRRSIKNKVTSKPGEVRGVVYSSGDVKYAAIHEYGGVTRAHLILPKDGTKALAFMSGGKMVFTRKVNHPGSKIPMRSYMRSSLKELTATIIQDYKNAVAEGLK